MPNPIVDILHFFTDVNNEYWPFHLYFLPFKNKEMNVLYNYFPCIDFSFISLIMDYKQTKAQYVVFHNKKDQTK